jgi:Ca2+-binding EF-hand superfamily protein
LAQYYQSVYARLFVENDEDSSGTITKFELKGVMVKLKESGFKVKGEDIANMFQDIDESGFP